MGRGEWKSPALRVSSDEQEGKARGRLPQGAADLVRQAVNQGGRLLVDRPVEVSEGFAPVAVVDARADMALCREATFAPVKTLFDLLRPEHQEA